MDNHPEPAHEHDIFLSAGGEQSGPHSTTNVKSLLASGLIPQDTLAWQPGCDGWRPLSEMMGITPMVSSPPPLSAPTKRQRRKFSAFTRVVVIGGLTLALGLGVLVLAGRYQAQHMTDGLPVDRPKLGLSGSQPNSFVGGGPVRNKAPNRLPSAKGELEKQLPTNDQEVFVWVLEALHRAARKADALSRDDVRKFAQERAAMFGEAYQERRSEINHLSREVVTEPELKEYLSALPSFIQMSGSLLQRVDQSPAATLEFQAAMLRGMRLAYLEQTLRVRYGFKGDALFKDEEATQPAIVAMNRILPSYFEITPAWVSANLYNQSGGAGQTPEPSRVFPMPGFRPRY